MGYKQYIFLGKGGFKIAQANVSLQILPVVAESEIYPVVDQVIELIKNSGVAYIVGPMETTMEGELEDLLGLVIKAQDICVQAGSKRVISIVKIDYKPDGVTMNEKIYKYRS